MIELIPAPLLTPSLAPQITKFNAAVEEILREGEAFLQDIELAEGSVQQAFDEYRDQVRPLCVCVCV